MAAAMKMLANAGSVPLTITEIVNSVAESFGPIPPGGSLVVPLSDAELAQQTTDADAAVAESAYAVGVAWVGLRMKRDRWLAQTDYIEAFINNPTVFAHLPASIQTAITNNSAAWVTWRQALRDLPANTADPTNATWPTPPAAPVIHLT